MKKRLALLDENDKSGDVGTISEEYCKYCKGGSLGSKLYGFSQKSVSR